MSDLENIINEKVSKIFESSFKYSVMLSSKYAGDPKALKYNQDQKIYIPDIVLQSGTVLPGIYEYTNNVLVKRLKLHNYGADNKLYRCFSFISSIHIVSIFFPVRFQFLFVQDEYAIKGSIDLFESERVRIDQKGIDFVTIKEYIHFSIDNLDKYNGVLYNLDEVSEVDVMGYNYKIQKGKKICLVWYLD